MSGIDSSGTPTCYGTGTNPAPLPGTTPPSTTTKTSSTSNADGSTTEKTVTTTGNRDGSTTTRTTEKTASADGKTVSVDVKDVTGSTPAGGQGKADDPKDIDDLCKRHPTLAMCRNSSVSGSCAQTSCEGDAIQCATLREAATIQCRQKDAEDALKASPLHALGEAASSGNDPEKGALPAPGNGQTVDVSALNSDGWLGGGAAFSDVSFTVQGHQFAVPLENATAVLVGLRYALMVVAALVSFRILSGAVLGS